MKFTSQTPKAWIFFKLLFEIILEWPLLFIFLTLIACFPLSSNPLSIGVILLFTMVFIRLILGIFSARIWVSYTLILVLVGGLLVVFIYVSLLASNELFNKISFKSIVFIVASVILSLILIFLSNSIEPITNSINQSEFLTKGELTFQWLNSLYSYYELGSLTLLLAFYLLFTLIIVVFVSKNRRLTLRTQI
jgi:NADH-ubiquinone oxidoreductase chain 6